MMFFASFAYSQNSGYKILGSSDYYQWVKIDEPRCGSGSFYIYISKEYNISSRLYYYKIFLWSDSYYRNCGVASTLINVFNVYIYANGKYSKVLNLEYILANPKSNYFDGWNYVAYVYTYNENQNFKITWEDVNSY